MEAIREGDPNAAVTAMARQVLRQANYDELKQGCLEFMCTAYVWNQANTTRRFVTTTIESHRQQLDAEKNKVPRPPVLVMGNTKGK